MHHILLVLLNSVETLNVTDYQELAFILNAFMYDILVFFELLLSMCVISHE